jgi:hypothetical protein
MSQSYLILFSSLQRLLSKVSYETFYRKHRKEGGNCHHPILGDSPKFTFFQNKKKIKNKGWQCGESRPRKAAKIGGNQAAIFGGISRPKCTLLCLKIEKCKFKGQIK